MSEERYCPYCEGKITRMKVDNIDTAVCRTCSRCQFGYDKNIIDIMSINRVEQLSVTMWATHVGTYSQYCKQNDVTPASICCLLTHYYRGGLNLLLFSPYYTASMGMCCPFCVSVVLHCGITVMKILKSYP